MADDTVRKPARGTRNREVEYFFFAVGLDRHDPIPEKIRPGPPPQALVTQLVGVVVDHRSRRREAEMRRPAIGGSPQRGHGARGNAAGAHGSADIRECFDGQSIDVRVRPACLERRTECRRGRHARAERANLLQESTLVLRARDIHRVHRPVRALHALADARHNPEPHQQGGHVERESMAAGREVRAVAAFLAGLAHRDASIRRPQVPEQKADLLVTQLEDLRRQALLVAALSIDAQVLQPLADAFRMPAIPVSTDEQLMPLPAAGITLHGGPERLRRPRDRFAVGFRGSCIAHGLMREIASVAHQVAQENELVVLPSTTCLGIRETARKRQPCARRELSHGDPSVRTEEAMLGGRPNRAAAREVYLDDWLHALRPHAIREGFFDPAFRRHGENLGRRPDKIPDGNAPSIRQHDQRVAGHAFAKVRHHRPLVLSRLDAAAELGERDHRQLELLREPLERARDLGDLGGAVLLPAARRHELQVIHHDQGEAPALPVQAPRARAHFQRVEPRAIVNIDLRLVELADRVHQPRPVILLEGAGPQLVLVHPPHRADHAHRQLRPAHFHAEHRHRLLHVERDVLGDVQDQRGLAHRGSAGDHDEVPALQAGGDAIEIDETGRQSDHLALVLAAVEHVDALHRFGEQRIDPDEPLPCLGARLGDPEHHRLGLIHQRLRVPPQRAIGGIGDLGADCGEVAHDGALANDLGVAADVGGAGGVQGERAEVGLAADVRKLGAALEALGHRQCVGGLAVLDELADVLEDQAVIGAIKILPGEQIGDLVPRGIVEQQPPEHRLLGFDRLRRDSRGFELGVLDDRGDDLSHDAPRLGALSISKPETGFSRR